MSNEEQGTPPPPQTVPDWARRIVPGGTFDRRVLQHTFWLSVRGEVQALDELSTSDLLCIVDGLGKQAVWLYGCELIDTYIGLRIAHEQGHASREELLADLGLRPSSTFPHQNGSRRRRSSVPSDATCKTENEREVGRANTPDPPCDQPTSGNVPA